MTRPLGRSKSFRERGWGAASARETREVTEVRELKESSAALPRPRVAFELTAKTLCVSDDQVLNTCYSRSHSQSRRQDEADRPNTSSGVPRRDGIVGLPANPHPLRQSPPSTSDPSPIPFSLPAGRPSEPDITSIGMALGSPRADGPPVVQLPYGGSDGFSTYSSSTIGTDSWPGRNHQSKLPTRQRSIGKWKLFGGMFGKRASPAMGSQPRPPLYQLAQTSEPPAAGATQQAHNIHTRPLAPVKDFSGGDQKPLDFQPKGGERRAKSVRHAAARKLVKSPSKATSRSQILEPHGPQLPTPELGLESSPMLDVDIPRIEMERYSVMFGSLLKPRNSSLLTRRQVTLEKLKDLDGSTEKKGNHPYLADVEPPTPKQSPGHNALSPSSSLFPVSPLSPSRDAPPLSPRTHLQSQLHRSNTSPSPLLPNRLASEHAQRPRDSGIVLMVHSPASENAPRYPPHWTPYTQRTSSLGSDSHESYIREGGGVRNPAHLSGSRWAVEDHMCETIAEEPSASPPAVNEISSPRRLATDVSNEEDARTKDAVEVSIQRQISRSRSQRQMLLPIVSDSERLVQRTKLKPVLVEVPSRRSHLVEYETA